MCWVLCLWGILLVFQWRTKTNRKGWPKSLERGGRMQCSCEEQQQSWDSPMLLLACAGSGLPAPAAAPWRYHANTPAGCTPSAWPYSKLSNSTSLLLNRDISSWWKKTGSHAQVNICSHVRHVEAQHESRAAGGDERPGKRPRGEEMWHKKRGPEDERRRRECVGNTMCP